MKSCLYKNKGNLLMRMTNYTSYKLLKSLDEDVVCDDVYNMKENVQQLPMKFISTLKYFL